MRAPEVRVVVVAPERRDLVLLALPADGDGPEPVLVDGVGEDRLRLLGQCVRGQVPVVSRPAEQGVAERAADDVGGVTGRPEGPQERR